MADLVGGPDGAALLELRDRLWPDGLASQQKTYQAEAGQALQLEERMTPAQTAKTDAILIGAGPNALPLTHFIQEEIHLGKQLGALEGEKGTLLHGVSGAAPGAALVKARNLWIRVGNLVAATAEVAEISADLEAVIFGPQREAERKADERARLSLKAKRKAPADPKGTTPAAGASVAANSTATGTGQTK